MKIDLYLSACTKFMSKWIKDLNIKPDPLNLIEDKIGKSLELIGIGEISLTELEWLMLNDQELINKTS